MVRAGAPRGRRLARAVTDAPRATVALCLVATLAMASLVPSLGVDSSESMWLPTGPRADAYREMAGSMGATEYVGVLAVPSRGSAVDPVYLQRLLELEDRALNDPDIASALRFPRDPDANVLSIADIAAQTGALLEARQLTFAQLAASLAQSTAQLEESAVPRAVAQAAAFVAIVSFANANPAAGHALVDKLVAELEVIAKSGEDAPFKAAAVDLMGVLADYGQWSRELSASQAQDAALVQLGTLLDAAFRGATSSGSSPGRQEALRALDDALVAARFGLAVAPLESREALEFGGDLEAGFGNSTNHSAASAFSMALATLIEAQRTADVPTTLGDPEAAAGLSMMAQQLAVVLGSSATARARSLAVELLSRVFDTALAMGDSGFDMSTPQGNVSYNALTAALEENATVLGSLSANLGVKGAAAADIQGRLASVIANNLALNESGVFTCQPCFARQMTMLQSLNESLMGLIEFLAQPSSPPVGDAGAQMLSAEILHVINVSAPAPHHIDRNVSSSLSAALRLVALATAAETSAQSAAGFERAAGAVLLHFDFESSSTISSSYSALLHSTASALGRFSSLLGGGEPAAARTTFAQQAAASFELPALTNGSLVGEAQAREVLLLSSRAAQDALELGEGDRSPALYARWCEVFRSAVAGGLASSSGILNGTDPGFVDPLAAVMAASHALFGQPSLSPQAQSSVENQTIAGSAVVSDRVVQSAPPPGRENRTEASQRLARMGWPGVVESLRVVLVPGARASSIPPGVLTADSRWAPFVTNLSNYRSSLEDELRAAYSVEARQLLPVGLEISPDSIQADSTVVLLLFDGTLDRQVLGQREDALRTLVGSQSSPLLKLESFGYGLMWLDTQRAMDLTVVLFSLSMVAAMFVALWVTYRRLFDALLTVLLLLFTVIWVLGTASLLGIKVNPITVIVPVLLIGLAEDYAVHVTMGYRRRRAQGSAPGRAGRGAVLAVGGVLLMATIINGLSFLSFGGAQIELIKDFGILMALGLVFAFLLSLTFIPAATVWMDRFVAQRRHPLMKSSAEAPTARREERGWSRRAVTHVVRTSLDKPLVTVAFVALVTAASFLSALEIPTTFSYAEVTAGDLPVSATLDNVSASLAGSIDRAYIFIEGAADEPAVFLAMAEVAWGASGDPYVVHFGTAPAVGWIGALAQSSVARAQLEGRSTVDPVAMGFQALDTDSDGRLTAADHLTQPGLADLYQALLDTPGSGAAQFVARSGAGFDRAAMVIDVRSAVVHADEIRDALEADVAPLRAGAAGAAVQRVTVTGPQVLNQEVMAAVQSSGWQSVLLTVALSAVLLALFFGLTLRAPLLGALCVVPTLVAVGWTLGLMALTGLTLNMMTVMIATSTVGIGDLYAIHIAHAHFKALRAGKGARAALAKMTEEAAVPLLGAAATTALGFVVLVASPVPAVRTYGALFAVSIVFAFLFSVALMPLIVSALSRSMGRTQDSGAPPGPEREESDRQGSGQQHGNDRVGGPVAGR